MFSAFSYPVTAIISLFVGFLALVLFALFVAVVCVIVYRVLRGKSSLNTIAKEVNFLDGVSAEEWDVIKTELLKQNRAELEEKVKAKLAKASGYEVEA